MFCLFRIGSLFVFVSAAFDGFYKQAIIGFYICKEIKNLKIRDHYLYEYNLLIKQHFYISENPY